MLLNGAKRCCIPQSYSRALGKQLQQAKFRAVENVQRSIIEKQKAIRLLDTERKNGGGAYFFTFSEFVPQWGLFINVFFNVWLLIVNKFPDNSLRGHIRREGCAVLEFARK